MLVTGGTPEALLTGEHGGWDIALDATHIHDTRNLSIDDQVKRIPRTATCAP